ncbi:Shedu immune nuclease family protein [Chryseobacterium sp. JJR-5R]|uniref:Shedu immune nuclease family protein n=1 Tax=Chryseobacterium sp. JJR-5R TaxID=3093923 RepID=UPI002A7542A2|nr:Shedu immune nuclease family protein [Chryseobacterium sp. JJR-5R]WPO82670.1 Shedu immune nuclease family protein [Chryseobacterium sp. JJR-5R]
MLESFPTSHEKKLYAQARVSSVIKSFFDSTVDAELKLEVYLNKRSSIKGTDLHNTFRVYELQKYEMIYQKLFQMLKMEKNYNENQWQDEILQIIQLLYPKYIFATKTVYLKIDNKKRRFLDFMLVDSNGNIDVIEIKKPFEKSIMSSVEYRGNYPPHKDLTGTIMQLEKYLFHLNRYGAIGEENLSKKYGTNLPEGLKISIVNPKGMVIMGRDNNLTPDQKSDFEVVKRKYKSVLDIITYDDLLRRLQFTIQKLQMD